MKFTILALAIFFAAIACAGCTPVLTQETKSQVNQIAQKAAIDAAEAKAKAAAAEAAAKNAPVFHPFAYINEQVIEIRPVLKWIGIIATFLTVLEWGLKLTSFDLLKPFAPIFHVFAVANDLAWFFLPALPWGILAVAIGIIVLWGVYLAKDHWNIGQAFNDLLVWAGIKSAPPATTPAPSTKPIGT